jgi:hypothetical protein
MMRLWSMVVMGSLVLGGGMRGVSQAAPAEGAAEAPEARRAAAKAEAVLPVRAVSLYKNGLGFFEQAGRVRGDQVVRIDLTTAQLIDVLQSFTPMVEMAGALRMDNKMRGPVQKAALEE